ncbi:hypothetical protein [Peribacillus deserti]|uniref:Uncharacterized protein n=1 Tax=Peribacillus deserti TaxID=673318 RepID=A0A2N5M5K7_9BACI|nr:hypothetical protein [Peribacillus deserti]PLT29625.1 hypothetical protein CUU66_12015 [Peribacillus deserti]
MCKSKKRKQKQKQKKKEFGTASFYCRQCDYHFEIDWETIWDIQESTHGYVGFHLNDTFISCDKCGVVVTEEEEPESISAEISLDLLFQ